MDNIRKKEDDEMNNNEDIKINEATHSESSKNTKNDTKTKDLQLLESKTNEARAEQELHEDSVKLMSPTRMVLRRFFRSKLSVIGLIMIVALFIFCFLGPEIYKNWESNEVDDSGKIEVESSPIRKDNTSTEILFYQVLEVPKTNNTLAKPDSNHPLGTDNTGRDVFARLMVGGRVSLVISFLSVFIITVFGVIFGGIAGYFGGAIDNIIMRICDILMCLPGFPILLIVSTLLDAAEVPLQYKIYFLMGFLTLISWSGTARLVRGQILSLREQEYMVAAEAMGYSTGRKIFKHLVPNVMPQLIVQMTLSLGSMILYEASLSYLGIGAPDEYAAWGTMINAANNAQILEYYFNIWGPPGICIIIAVLGFNFVGDGLRDALDPKMRR